MLPILYSYRRCPYAMRARMALKLAGIQVEIREISLRDKPAHLLQVSPKATVPVLVLPDGRVIDESLEIMFFALKQHTLGSNGPGHPLSNSLHEFDSPCIHAACRALIFENDTSFKQALDAYKYPEKHPNKTQAQHRADGEQFLRKLESLLSQNTYLLQATPSLADIAIFPFIRQFAAVDSIWFETSPYPKLRAWLNGWVESELFKSVMQKQAVNM
jgi:glutathione S-transferase